MLLVCCSPPGGQIPSPSPVVEKTEKAIAITLSQKSKSAGQARYPERPGFGTVGRKVLLYANYFELPRVGKVLYRYHVDIVKDQAGRQPTGKKAQQVIRLLLEEHFASNLKSIATDYKSTLISAVELPNKGAYDVRYRDEYEDEYPEDPKIYRVTCQATGSLQPSDLFSYLSSTSAMAMFESKAEILQAMNIVMGHSPKSDRSIASVGASKHFSVHPDSAERFDLGGGLQVLRGFFVSVRTATARLLVNVQVKYAACYEEGPLKTVISAYQNANSQNLYKLESFLKRVKVRVMHIQRKNKVRIKTIAGLATLRDGSSLEHPPRVTAYGAGPKDVAFFLNPGQQQSAQPGAGGSGKGKKGKKKDPKTGPEPAGRYISVADFFLQGKHSKMTVASLSRSTCFLTDILEYNVKTDPKIPVVNVGTRESPSYLPAEVCFVQPGQPAGVKLAPNQTRNMLNFAVRSPAENAKFIVEKGVQVLGLSTQNETLVSPPLYPLGIMHCIVADVNSGLTYVTRISLE